MAVVAVAVVVVEAETVLAENAGFDSARKKKAKARRTHCTSVRGCLISVI